MISSIPLSLQSKLIVLVENEMGRLELRQSIILAISIKDSLGLWSDETRAWMKGLMTV
jgi:hypothetical protein